MSTPNQETPDVFRTSKGEIVKRGDLTRVAALDDPNVDEDEHVMCARAALAGDQTALDEFHNRTGLVLSGVTEHCYKKEVRLLTVDEWILNEQEDTAHARAHVVFSVWNPRGQDSMHIDAAELVNWVLSPEGRTALARREIAVVIPPNPRQPDQAPHSLLDKIEGPIRAEHLPRTIDRLETILRKMLKTMPDFDEGLPLAERLGTEMASLREAAREACRLAQIPWSSTCESARMERWINSLKNLVRNNG
jgi:hypothetical protein